MDRRRGSWVAVGCSVALGSAQILQWVDAQAASGRLDPRVQITDPSVPRPGKFAIRLDPATGFGTKFTARVLVDKAERPIAVFIGNNPWRGFIVALAPGADLVLPPIAKRIDDRTVLVCTNRD